MCYIFSHRILTSTYEKPREISINHLVWMIFGTTLLTNSLKISVPNLEQKWAFKSPIQLMDILKYFWYCLLLYKMFIFRFSTSKLVDHRFFLNVCPYELLHFLSACTYVPLSIADIVIFFSCLWDFQSYWFFQRYNTLFQWCFYIVLLLLLLYFFILLIIVLVELFLSIWSFRYYFFF